MSESATTVPVEDFEAVARLAAGFIASRGTARVVSNIDPDAVKRRLQRYNFDEPLPAVDLANDMFDLLDTHAVRGDRPRYFGLFNPPLLPAGVLGDLIAVAVNPQLAIWSHAPAAAAVERMVLDLLGQRLGWSTESTAGTYTSGGSEANLTALMAALARRYPRWAESDLSGVAARPEVYVSSESHLAWVKIARLAGLGSDAVLIVATAGTTAHGAVDRMAELAQVASEHTSHFHVDAAWAGSAVLSDMARPVLDGIEHADSVTIDPHKWLCVPMGAGIYLARDWQPLETAFEIATSYMPSASSEYRDPYIHSLQWSRRFTGMKLFMVIATLGRSGYAVLIDPTTRLRGRLVLPCVH